MDMDLHTAMETFAEAWVAANTQTAVNPVSASESSILQVAPPSSLKVDQQQQQQQQPPTMIPAVTNDTINSPRSSPNPPPPQQQPPVMTRSRPPSPKQPSTSCNTGAAKSVPIHCIVEQMSSPGNADSVCPSQHAAVTGAAAASVELDSYAIIPCSTLFNEIVRSALMKLGYSTTESMTAKGAIQVKNWKPLSFEQITDNPEATVEDILSDLTTVATLRIRIYSDQTITWTDHAVRCAVIGLLKETSQTILASQCPLSQSLISNIANLKYSAKISREKCREFGVWYDKYRREKFSNETAGGATEGAVKDTRLTFHPKYELPIMRKWYSECNNPTDRLLERYVTELNESATRHDRAQLTVHNLRNWWKNERQREKKHGPRTMKFQEPRPCFTYYDETAANPASGKVHITFDTVHEIPLLRHWYTSNKKPSNELLQHYANTLNHSPVRDGKPKVNYHKLRNWWNNEKQRERKSEQHQLPRRGPGRPPKYPALNEQAKTTDNSAATATSGAEPYYKRQRTSDHHQQGERPVSQNEQPPVAPSSPPLQLTNLVNSPSRASGIQRSSPISQSLNFHHHGLDLLAESQFYGGHAPGAMMFTAYQPSSSTPLFPSPSPYRPLSLSNARESPSERSSQHSNKDNT